MEAVPKLTTMPSEQWIEGNPGGEITIGVEESWWVAPTARYWVEMGLLSIFSTENSFRGEYDISCSVYNICFTAICVQAVLYLGLSGYFFPATTIGKCAGLW